MTTEDRDRKASISRVVVALAGAETSSSVIDMAVFVAAVFRAEISGLYVEEEGLLELGDLPSAIIHRSGAPGPMMLGKDQLRSTWQRHARAFRENLLVGARRYRLSCDFATRTGNTLVCLSEAAAGRDLVAISGGQDPMETRALWEMVRVAARTAQGVIISARQFAPEPDAPILAIDDGDVPGAATIRFAAAIASATQRPLHVLALAEPDEIDRIAARARELAGVERPIVHPLSIWVRDRIAVAVARLRPTLVVADLGGPPFEDDAQARRLLRALTVPLILLAPGKQNEKGSPAAERRARKPKRTPERGGSPSSK